MPDTPSAWSLDPQLRNDTADVGDLPLCRLLVSTDATYPWLILVPRRPATTELIDLDAADRARLIEEIAEASRALKQVTSCDKLNVAALGNMVAQLHVHVIARWRGDVAWPRPVWGVASPAAWRPDALDSFASALRTTIGLSS